MTTLDLDALERAARAATPGPWDFRTLENFGGNVVRYRDGDRFDIERVAKAGLETNATFIAAANPAAILSLISDYRALQERVEGAEKALRPFPRVAEQDIGEDEADDDMFRPMLAFNRAPQPKIGDFRAVLAYFAARTKTGDPHEQE